ncbi:hypothetical protein ACJMK2_010939, partial [Sinanodonta woodiana]
VHCHVRSKMVPKIVRSAVGVFFEYDTPRIVHIRSKKVGVINRFIQLVIIGYVIGYAIVYKKGYQEFDDVQGAVTTKLKGVALTNLSLPGLHDRIWDVVDYVVPSQENSAFFVTTNLIITENQTMRTCEEDPSVYGADCTQDPGVCIKGQPLEAGDGYMTGNCINSTRQNNTKVCEVFAWCETEVEKDPPNPPVLSESSNFTVFIKNNVEFPKFGVKRRNIPSFTDAAKYLKTCRYDSGSNSICPVFRLETITQGAKIVNYQDIATQHSTPLYYYKSFNRSCQMAAMRNIIGYNKTELTTCRFKLNHPPDKFCPIFILSDIVSLAGERYDDMAQKGGVIQIVIQWDCNLDYSQDECNPAYTFRRLDTKDDIVSPGYNFRYAHFYKDAVGTESRTLYKAYGIRFIITVQGRAGKFNFVPLMLNVGSGLALLSIATILCDIVVLYILKARSIYREKKYLEVIGDDAYKTLEGDVSYNHSMEGEEANRNRSQ